MELSIFPTDKGESVSPYVSKVVDMIRDSGASYRLTPMGTLIETEELAEALAFVEKAGQILLALGCGRVYSVIKLDIRPGKGGRMDQKIRSIEDRIGTVDK